MPRFPARPAGSEHVGLINTGCTFRVRKRHQPHVYMPTLWSLNMSRDGVPRPANRIQALYRPSWTHAQRSGCPLHQAAWSVTPNSWCPSNVNAWPSSEPPPSLSSDPQPHIPFLCHPGLNCKYFGHDGAFAGCQGVETVKQVAFSVLPSVSQCPCPDQLPAVCLKVQGTKRKTEIKCWFPRKQQCILYSEMFSLVLLIMKLTLHFNRWPLKLNATCDRVRECVCVCIGDGGSRQGITKVSSISLQEINLEVAFKKIRCPYKNTFPPYQWQSETVSFKHYLQANIKPFA